MGKVTGAKGYQLQYALNKKFKKKKSIQTKKTKYTIKKLKKKKTYYIRVRAYKMNDSLPALREKEQPKKEHQEGYRKGTTVSYERSEK